MSAVHDGRCRTWVMCSCSVVRGNQIRDNIIFNTVIISNVSMSISYSYLK